MLQNVYKIEKVAEESAVRIRFDKLFGLCGWAIVVSDINEKMI